MADTLNAGYPQTIPPQIRQLYRTQPGLFDPTQPTRLLRLSGSRLSFASFDPLTASVQASSDLRKPNLNAELYRPKRVVIETAPTGESTWRFVPSAKRDEGVADEGNWPRVVNLCGQYVHMTQDEWDIHKLDPYYECTVHMYPNLTTIQYVGSGRSRPLSPKATLKRPLSSRSPSPIRERPPPGMSKTASVEEMIINDWPVHNSHEEEEPHHKQGRRNGLNSNYNLNGSTTTIFSGLGTTSTPLKRKADDDECNPLEATEQAKMKTYNANRVPKRRKRARTTSPNGDRDNPLNRQSERPIPELKKRVEQFNPRSAQRPWQGLDGIIEEVGPQPFPPFPPSGTQQVEPFEEFQSSYEASAQPNQEEILDEEALHHAALEESRRKLAELEKDRPLWEEAARKRRQREEAEQEARRAKSEARKLEEAREKAKAEAEEKARKAREQEEKRKREEQERIREQKERREREQRQRQQRWATGLWTTQRALERYRVLCETFDNSKYNSEYPLMVGDVPWPVLSHPSQFSVEDVTWDAVEKFFEAVRPHMRHQDYKTFVEKSHRRFHPDRWKSRALLRTIEDEAVRGCMEVAANTVAQALTPLWRNLTGR